MAAPTIPTVAEFHTISGSSVTAQLSGAAWKIPNTSTQLNPAQYDTVLAFLTTSNDVTAVSTPTGWRGGLAVAGAGTPSLQRGQTYWFKRTMSAADVGSTASHTWNVTRSAGTTWINVSLIAIRGSSSFHVAENLGPTFGVWIQSSGPDTLAAGPSTSTYTLPAVDNLLLFHAVPNQSGSSPAALIELTPPTSMTKVNFFSALAYQAFATYTAAVTGATPNVTTFPAKTATFQHNTTPTPTAYSGRNIAVLVDAPANAAPTVSAGADTSVASGSAVTLTGTASDPFGSIDTSSWTQTSGPSVSLAPVTGTFQVVVTGGVPGTAVLQFSATDNDGATTNDTMSLTVTNTTPVVNAGTDTTAVGGTSVTLTGASVTDATVGDTLTYVWTRQSGPTISGLTNDTTLSPTFTVQNTTGSLVMRLTATDSHGASAFDDVTVAVTASTPQPVSIPTQVVGQIVLPNSAASVRVVAVIQNSGGSGEVHYVRELLLAHGTTETWSRGGLAPSVTVETRDPGDVDWQPAWNLDVESNVAGVVVVRDRFAPANLQRRYRGRAVSAVPGEPILSSDPSSEATATFRPKGWVFRHPTDHTLDVAVNATRESFQRSKRRQRAKMHAFGRRNDIESVGDELGDVFGLNCQFWTQPEWDRFEGLFDAGVAVLVQPSTLERQWWATLPEELPEVLIPTVDIATAPFRTVTVTLTEADRP
jgi:hypothetical protein